MILNKFDLGTEDKLNKNEFMIKERDGYIWQPQLNEPEFKTEEQLQAHCVQWFDKSFPQWRQMLFSVPNGANLPKKLIRGQWVSTEAAKLKATGLQSGVSDLILISFVESLFLECKLPGCTQDPAQITFQAKVEERGHAYIVFKYFTHFQDIIMSNLIKRRL